MSKEVFCMQKKTKICAVALLTVSLTGLGVSTIFGWWGWPIKPGDHVIDIQKLLKQIKIESEDAKRIQAMVEEYSIYLKRMERIANWRSNSTGTQQLADNLGKAVSLSTDVTSYIDKNFKAYSIEPDDDLAQQKALANMYAENNKELLTQAAQHSLNNQKITELRQKISEIKETGDLSAIQKASYLDALSTLERMELIYENAEKSVKTAKDAIADYTKELQNDAKTTAYWTVKAYDPFHPENTPSIDNPNLPEVSKTKSEDLGFVKFPSNFSN